MSSNGMAVLKNIRSDQSDQWAIEALANPKIWAGVTAGAALAGVVTAAIAFMLPAASVICGTVAITLGVAAAVCALIGTGIHIAKKQELFDWLFFVNGHRIADRGQVTILRQFAPSTREFIVAQRLFDARNLCWKREQLNHFSGNELKLLLKHFGQAFSKLDFEGLAGPMPESLDVGRCSNLKRLIVAGQAGLQTIEGLKQCPHLRFISLSNCQTLDENRLLEALNQAPNPKISIDFGGSNLVISQMDRLQQTFASHGIWGQFLERHPSCTLSGLVALDEATVKESKCDELLGLEAFQLVRPDERDSSCDVRPLTELVIDKTHVTKRKWIKLLFKFIPSQREAIARAGLLDSGALKLRGLCDDFLCFKPEQLQLLLDHFGQQFASLSFNYYKFADRLTSLDVSHCINLEEIDCDALNWLQTLSGLENCHKLRTVGLEKCWELDRNAVLQSLLQIQNSALKVSCLKSSLAIRTLEDLETQLAPDGLWLQFLKAHPSCVVYNLVDEGWARCDKSDQDRLQTACAKLVGPYGFQVIMSLKQLGSYNVRPAGSKD